MKRKLYFLGIIIIFLIVIKLYIFNHGNSLYWGDAVFCITSNCFDSVKDLFIYRYNPSGFGIEALWQEFQYIPMLLQYILSIIFGVNLSVYILLFILFFISFNITFYVLLKIFKKSNLIKIFLLSLFYTFSPWIIDRIVMGHIGIWLGYIFFPFLIYLYYSIFSLNKKNNYIYILTTILSSFLLYVWPQIGFFVFITFIYFIIRFKKFNKKILLFIIILFLLLSFLWLPLYFLILEMIEVYGIVLLSNLIL